MIKSLLVVLALLISFILSHVHSTTTTIEGSDYEELPTAQPYHSGLIFNPGYSRSAAYNTLRKTSSESYGHDDHHDTDYYEISDPYHQEHDFVTPDKTHLQDKLKYLLKEKSERTPSARSSLLDFGKDQVSQSGIQKRIDRGGGHKMTCTTGYINASAVSLLAFLLLLNLLQNIVTQITTRRRRDVDPLLPPSALLSFMGSNGLGALQEEGPAIALNLMVKMSESEEPKCIYQPLCQANKNLVERFNVAGNVIGTLFSNIVAQAYSAGDAEIFAESQSASAAGRRGNCDKVPRCHKQQ